MSTSNSTIKGKYDEVAGKVKQAAGEAVHNESLVREKVTTTAQHVKEHVQAGTANLRSK
jgi:uncharacterized protein YjbJ (UPF0337 family)